MIHREEGTAEGESCSKYPIRKAMPESCLREIAPESCLREIAPESCLREIAPESCLREIVRDVFIMEYQVMEEASTDIIDSIEEGCCPICKDKSKPKQIPNAGDLVVFKCVECGIEITIEVWEV